MKCASTLGELCKVIVMCTVPVKITSKQWEQITTYEILDNCRQGSFFHEIVLKQPEVKGIETTLNLQTLEGERS